MKLKRVMAVFAFLGCNGVVGGSMQQRLREYQAQAQPGVSSVVSLAVTRMDEDVLLYLAVNCTPKDITNQIFPGLCPLQKAIQSGKVEIFNVFVQLATDVASSSWLTQADFGGRKPLHCLAESNCFGLSEMDALLGKGIDVNDRAQGPAEGATALHLAGAVADNPNMICWLLERGADPTLLDGNGQTATVACSESYDKNVEWMDQREKEVHLECLCLLQQAERDWVEKDAE